MDKHKGTSKVKTFVSMSVNPYFTKSVGLERVYRLGYARLR